MSKKKDLCTEGREKYWSEIGDKEKIVRIRGIVKQQQNEIRRLSSLVEALVQHDHGKSGQLLSPIRFGGYETFSPSPRNDEVYF